MKRMKKMNRTGRTCALLAALLLASGCFTGCEKNGKMPKDEGGEEITENTDTAEGTDAPDENGGIPEDRRLVTKVEAGGDGKNVDCFYAEALGEGLFAIFDEDYSIAIADAEGSTVLPYEYAKKLTIADGILPIFSENGGWGYYSLEKKDFIVPCGYENAYAFSEGLGLLYDGEYYLFVDTEGNTVIEGLYEAVPFSDGLARVMSEEGLGYINKNGRMKLFCDYEYFDDFHCGMARASDGTSKGFIDKTGKMKFAVSCDKLYNYSEDLACIVLGTRTGYMDKNGEVVITGFDAMPNGNRDEYFMFSGGVAPVMRDGKAGFVNKNGAEVVECVYDRVYLPSQGTIRVEKDGKTGFVAVDGSVICECIYDKANNFSGGLALVRKDGKCGYINACGKEVTDIAYVDGTDFSGDAALVLASEESETWELLKITGCSEKAPFTVPDTMPPEEDSDDVQDDQ